MKRYGQLVRISSVPTLLIGAALGRLVMGMAPLGIVLLGYAATGSYAQAGAAAAAYALAAGLVSPVLGRLVDRIGQTRVLYSCAAGSALAFPAVALSPDAGVVPMIVAAGVAGAVTPPLSACLRAVWAELLRGTDRLETAFALESMLQELTYLVGPLLVVTVATAVSPAAALLLAGTTTVVGTLIFAASHPSRTWQGSPRTVDATGPLRSAGVRAILAVAAGNAAAFGVIEVAVPAFSQRSGDPSLAGWLLAVWSLGSLLGGIAYGSRSWTGEPWRRLVVLLALHAGTLALLAVASTRLGLALALAATGLSIAPWIACSYLLLDRSAPTGTVTEAFTWLTSAFAAGIAIGNALGGLVVQRAGVAPAFALAAGFGLTAVLAAGGRLTTMRGWHSRTASRPT